MQDVQSIEIRYQYMGLDRADEVHRLVPGSGRRSFVRRSSLQTAAGEQVSNERVPAQRVSELLWAMSAPAWSRERGVEMVARRVRPVRLIEQAKRIQGAQARGCTAAMFDRQLRSQLRGRALHAQVDAHFNPQNRRTDDDPSMRVVIEYRNGPPRVLTSDSQRLQMLPWSVVEPGAPAAVPTSNWSVAVSQAILRVLPPESMAVKRLQAREDRALEDRIFAAAEATCGPAT